MTKKGTSNLTVFELAHSDDLGRLADAMLVEDSGTIDFAAYVHPRVEPEIAFMMQAPLGGQGTLPGVSSCRRSRACLPDAAGEALKAGDIVLAGDATPAEH